MARDTRRKYTKEFKLKVVREYLGGSSLTELSKMYGIAPSTLGTWFATLKEEALESVEEVEEEEVEAVIDPEILKELESLRRENKELSKIVAEQDETIAQLKKTPIDPRIEEVEGLVAEVNKLREQLATVKEEAKRELTTLKDTIIILTRTL